MKCKRILAVLTIVAMTCSMLVTPVSAAGWTKSGNSVYYQQADGSYVTGWAAIGDNRYYFGSNGKMATGFKKIGDNKYCFDGNGRLVHGVAITGDTAYIFGYDGSLYGTMKKTAFENLKARSPEPKFTSTEPIQYTSKGVNKGYVNTSFYANLDSNFYKIFGMPSTKASVIKNMGDDDKYITYMLYAYMNNYCVSSKTYNSWKSEAQAYLKSIQPNGKGGYNATGAYTGMYLSDLALVRPIALLRSVDFALFRQDGAGVNLSNLEGKLSGYFDNRWSGMLGGTSGKSGSLTTISESLSYDLKSTASKTGINYTYGTLHCVLDDGKYASSEAKSTTKLESLWFTSDCVNLEIQIFRGKTLYELNLTYSPITGYKTIWVKVDSEDDSIKQFKTLAEAEEYIWG